MPTAANRQPAVAVYLRREGDDHYRLLGLNVLDVEAGLVRAITSFGVELLGGSACPRRSWPTDEFPADLGSKQGTGTCRPQRGGQVNLIVNEFLTLDGVMQAPGDSDEDRAGGFEHGGWQMPYLDEAAGNAITEGMATAGGFLLGRRTYEIFAAFWPSQPDDDPIAATLNNLPPNQQATDRSLRSLRGRALVGFGTSLARSDGPEP